MGMLLKVFITMLLATCAYADNPPTRLYDEGVLLGTVSNLDCTGSSITCSKSGVTGTLNVTGGSVTPFTGTTNQVSYYTSSTTTGGNAGFIFNGTSVGIGTSVPNADGTTKLHIVQGAGAQPDWNYDPTVIIQNNSSSSNSTNLSLLAGTAGTSDILFTDSATPSQAFLRYNHSDDSFAFWNRDSGLIERLRISSSGNVGIGTTLPAQKLDMVSGGFYGYNGVKLAYGQSALSNFFFGKAGNPTLATMTGSDNNGFGDGALYSLAGGNENNAMGVNAAAFTTSGVNNIAIGRDALLTNTTGGYQVAIGYRALRTALTTGTGSVAIGQQALEKSVPSSAVPSTAVGYYASYEQTTGIGNTAIGSSALQLNTTGSYNMAVGYQALTGIIGSNNLGFGAIAGGNNTSGNNNIYFGYNAATNQTSGSKNIIIGESINAPNAAGSNQLNIGNLIFGTGLSGTGSTIAGNIGIGTTLPRAQLEVKNQMIFAFEYDNGNSGTTKTIAWTNGNKQKVTLTDNCTFTFTAPQGVGDYTLKIVMDGMGGYTNVWPSTVKFAGGYEPAMTLFAGATEIINFYFDGTNYLASWGSDLKTGTGVGSPYLGATSGSAIQKANGSGGLTAATAATDYAPATSGTDILKGDGAGGFTGLAVGITDSTSYSLCTAALCATQCQLSIVDGLITGCI